MTDEKQPGGRNTDAPQYDPGIVPQEVKARKEREGENFGDTSQTPGMTVDQEGIANIYPVEPEMYVDQPGDLRQEEEAAKAARVEEVEEVKQDDEAGRLTPESDTRGKGPGGR